MKKLLLASALLLSMGSAHAADKVRWDSVSASYESLDLDGSKFTGFGVSGTKLLNENVFLTGSYSSVSDDVTVYGSTIDFELNSLSVGAGYRYALSNTTDFFGVVSYVDLSAEVSGFGTSGDGSESGFGLEGGVRSLLNEQFELMGSISYVDVADDSEVGFGVKGIYHFNEQFSASLGYQSGDDTDGISAAVIMFF
ncbi:outer membrane beta-barrel protein [Psychrosphaera aestuarii]|uniref:outer membrane beta-barrel protein n=1 Tax=Psychrosphaera aestuarii TaxID=1266052 RepID=UPI001B337A5F|nr:outer membrane beta-barrel protein [Psychrosphaera aestuarii]